MSNTSHITPLKVGNVDFLVTSAIERCPSTMMARELVMNAVEAAKNDPSGKGLVVIRAKELTQFPGVRKLAYWNNGPGMSAIELAHICDIAASLKEMSLEANFGMGAKVSALRVNHLGMRYRSCKDGIVSQVVIGYENRIYGKLRQLVRSSNGTETYEDVFDATEIVLREGEYRLEHDWTEVVLLGNRADQDTVFDPYGDGKSYKQWLHDILYHRFYRLPENVTIRIEEDAKSGDSNRIFKTIPQRLHVYGKHETVTTSDGIKITYIHDPARPDGSHNISRNGAMSSTPAHIAVVYKGEMYDVRSSNKWNAISPEFGVPFATKHVVIHIELPDDYDVVPEAYRRFLQLSDGDQHQITVFEFASYVRDHRPEWLIDIIKAAGPKPSADASAIQKDLQELLNSLAVRANGPRFNPQGDKNISDGVGRGEGPSRNSRENSNPKPGSGSKPTHYQESTEGAKRASYADMIETAPKPEYLDEDEQIEIRGLIDRVACFDKVNNILYVNTKYRAIDEIVAELERIFAHARAEHGDKVYETAKRIAVNIATIKAGRAIVHAKAKAILNSETWNSSQIDNSYNPEALSVKVDDWADAAEHAYREMRKALGLSSRQARVSKLAAE